MLSSVCSAQQWEVGALGAYGWHRNATIVSPDGRAEAGFEPRFAIGGSFTQNMYRYVSGEIRYMFLVGDPVLKFQGIEASTNGFTNIVHYDLLFHPRPSESRLRPYVAAGGGVKVYSATDRLLFFNQPLLNFAVLRQVDQAEPMVSLGVGLKYIIKRHVQLRLDFHTYMSPTPDDLFRPTFPSKVHGWIYDFVPALGISYAF
jgi:hypothetical protein